MKRDKNKQLKAKATWIAITASVRQITKAVAGLGSTTSLSEIAALSDDPHTTHIPRPALYDSLSSIALSDQVVQRIVKGELSYLITIVIIQLVL